MLGPQTVHVRSSGRWSSSSEESPASHCPPVTASNPRRVQAQMMHQQQNSHLLQSYSHCSAALLGIDSDSMLIQWSASPQTRSSLDDTPRGTARRLLRQEEQPSRTARAQLTIGIRNCVQYGSGDNTNHSVVT